MHVPFSSSPPLPDYPFDYFPGLYIAQDHYDDVPAMIDQPEEFLAAWKTITTKHRPLQHAFVEGFVQTTAARRAGNDPGSSGRTGDDLGFSAKAASTRDLRTSLRH